MASNGCSGSPASAGDTVNSLMTPPSKAQTLEGAEIASLLQKGLRYLLKRIWGKLPY